MRLKWRIKQKHEQAKKSILVYYYGTLSICFDLLAPPFVDSAIRKKSQKIIAHPRYISE